MDAILRDVRLSVRSLLRNPAFTVVAVLTLSLGIGATTSIFSVVNAVVLEPLPYTGADRLVHIRTAMTDGRQTTGGMSPLAHTRIMESSQTISHASGAFGFEVSLQDLTGTPVKTVAVIVDRGYFDVFATPMAVGRGFLPEENVAGGPPVAVLSYPFWRDVYGADPALVGNAVPTATGSFTIVGIAPPGFDYPPGTDVWIAFGPDPEMAGFFLDGVARLSPGATTEQAGAELGVMAQRIAQESNSFRNRTMLMEPLQDHIVGDMRSTLIVLLGGAGVLMLIACANVMNLLLGRGAGRAKEVALQAALGARRGRIIQALLTESLVLAGAGAVVGLVGTVVALRIFGAIGPADLPRIAEVGIDLDVVLFAVGLVAITGVAFGLAPAVRLARSDIRTLMGESARGSSGGPGSSALFGTLVVAQMGLAVALVIGAGLLVRSFSQLQAVDPGFDPSDVLAVNFNLSNQGYTPAQVADFYRNATDAIQELPGVTDAGVASELPLGASIDFFRSTQVVGKPETDEPERARQRIVSPEYFGAMDIELLEGRLLDDRDRFDQPGVVVVNEAFVQRFLQGDPPLGQRITFTTGVFNDPNQPLGHIPASRTEWEIVGVVEDVKYRAIDEPTEASFFLTYEQAPWRRMFVTVESSTDDVASLSAGVRDVIWGMDRTLPLEIELVQDVVDRSLARQRLAMLLLAAFGVSALILAAVGIYGVISYGVKQRTTELAIRASLGATPNMVVSLAMRQGLLLAGGGVLAGVVLAYVGRQVIASQLYEITATDPTAFVTGPGALLVTGFLAVLIPALRATKIHLSDTLRAE